MCKEEATNYNNSDIKYVVDAWASDKFTDELKTVDGYSARLVKQEEIRTIGWPSCSSTIPYCDVESTTPSWLYSSSYWYWTMTPHPASASSAEVWVVYYFGDLSRSGIFFYTYSAVRPVINVYQAKLS